MYKCNCLLHKADISNDMTNFVEETYFVDRIMQSYIRFDVKQVRERKTDTRLKNYLNKLNSPASDTAIVAVYPEGQ